jgi:hypothetical protein
MCGEMGPSDQGEHVQVVQYSLWNKTVIRVGVSIRGSVLCLVYNRRESSVIAVVCCIFCTEWGCSWTSEEERPALRSVLDLLVWPFEPEMILWRYRRVH